MTLVLINDFVSKKRVKMYYTSEEFDYVELVWNTEDKLLVDLQDSSFFAGRTRWCDLEPSHLRFLIEQNLTMVENFSVEERKDSNNYVITSLNFLICTLIYCIEKKLDANLEMIKVSRITPDEVSFEFTGGLQLEGKPKIKTEPFSVIVDNT